MRRWGYDVVVAANGIEAAQTLLSPDAPKLAVLDWLMPGLDGVQLCQDVRRNKPDPYTYLILLTSKNRRQDVISGLEAGADDYMTKPFDPAELKVRLRTGKRIIYLQDQLISAREALRDMATARSVDWILESGGDFRSARDRVKAGPARRGANRHRDRRSGLLQADQRHARPPVRRRSVAAVGASDAQHDAALRRRGRDGGEEFLIILPGCDSSNALCHAERMCAAVSRVMLETPAGVVRPTISLGVAVCDKRSYVDPLDLVATADAALYRAKHAGRNQVALAVCGESLLAAL